MNYDNIAAEFGSTAQEQPDVDYDAMATDLGSLALPLDAQQQNDPLSGAMSGGTDFQPQANSDTYQGIVPLLSKASNFITGADKKTEMTENPDILQVDYMPEVNSLRSLLDPQAWKAIAGTILNGDPKDRAQIYKANFPDLQITTDEKGNYFYKSKDGKIYKDAPGFRATDIPNAIVGAGLGVAEGLLGGASVGGQMLMGVLSELGNEVTQYLTGGESPDYLNVAASGMLSGAPGAAQAGKRAIGKTMEDLVTPKGMSPTFNNAMAESIYDPLKGKSMTLRPNKKTPLIENIQLMMGRGDVDGLARAAKETPEAFQVAQMKGPRDVGKVSTPNEVDYSPPEVIQLPVDSIQGSLGEMAQEATKSKSKKEAFAQFAKQNSEAVEALNRREINMPPDVSSDSGEFMATAMGPRLSDRSKASDVWSTQLKAGSEQMNKLMTEAGADTANVNVSSKILGKMVRKKDGIKKEAGNFFNEIDKLIPDETPILFFNGEIVARDISKALDRDLMTPEVKKALKKIEKGAGSYLDLRTMKKNLRLAQEKTPTGFFSGLEEKTLGKLDKALKADQIDNVSTLISPEVGSALKIANRNYAKAMDTEKVISKAFGDEQNGSIGRSLKTALANVNTDDSAINELMVQIPKEYHAEMLLTGILDASRVKTTGSRLVKDVDFGFSEFSSMYKKMKINTKFMKTLQKTIGGDRMALLKDLDNISQRITNVRAFQTRNGKDLGPMLEAMQAENLVANVLKSPAIKAVTGIAPFGVGKAANAMQEKASDLVSTGGAKAMESIGELFQDPVFLGFVSKLSTTEMTESAANKLAKTSAFVKFAKTSKIKAPEKWIMQAVRTQPEDKNK